MPKQKPIYTKLREGYGGAFSIYGALKGLTRRFDPDVQCWCTEASDPNVQLKKGGQWYPVQLCQSCEATTAKQQYQ